MSDIQELIDTCERLCKRLGDMANEEQKFNMELCRGFDMMSWEAWKMGNDIKMIVDRFGVR